MDVDAERVRLLVARFCEIAVGAHYGVTVDDAVYRAVTEGRDPGPGYSSCGDLAHWLLMRMGVRASFVNREEAPGGYRGGQNVSLLAGALWGDERACPTGTATPEEIRRGDIALVWNHAQGRDAHVFVVDHWDEAVAFCWDYGGGAIRPEHYTPGMTEGRRTLKDLSAPGDGRVLVGQPPKQLRCVIPLLATLEHCRARGELAEADDPDEWLSEAA